MSFAPPSHGSAFHSADEVPLAVAVDVLRALVAWLQCLTLAPEPLERFDDWLQHDGLHFPRGGTTYRDLFGWLASPRALLEASHPDDSVFVGVAPASRRWYLRFRAEWDAEDTLLVASFALVVVPELAATLREWLAERSGSTLYEQPAADYLARLGV